MKRSEINKIINETIDYMKGRDFPLPPFAYWGKKDWENAGNEYQEIVDNMLAGILLILELVILSTMD